MCDANPHLLRAAKHYGETTDKSCPVCRRAPLVHVTYTFGDELGQSSGGARTSGELTEVAERYAEIQVYVVEVCRSCEWNHLIQSFVIGHGRARSPRGPWAFRPLSALPRRRRGRVGLGGQSLPPVSITPRLRTKALVRLWGWAPDATMTTDDDC